jgi:acyl carrier protein
MSERSMINHERIREAIIDHVLSNYVCPYDRISLPLDQSLVELEVLDSYGVVELVFFLESHWSITIADSEITREKMGSINKITALVQQNLKKSRPHDPGISGGVSRAR